MESTTSCNARKRGCILFKKMSSNFKLSSSHTLFCTWTFAFLSIAVASTRNLVDAFEPYRVPGINPTCVPVTTPACLPITNDFESIISQAGRNKRSVWNDKVRQQALTSNHNLQKNRNGRSVYNAADADAQWRYNYTTFPNFANDRTPDDVIESLRQFHPLLATECSKFVRLFLCSVYSPICTEFGVVPPCKELCEKVQSDCARTVETFGIEWPESVKCSFFPSFMESQDNDVINEPMYVGSMTSSDDDYTIMIQRAASLTWIEALAGNGKICIPPTFGDVITPQLEALAKNEADGLLTKNNISEVESPTRHKFGMLCPAEMRSPPGQPGYTFLGMQNCSPPCPNMYLSEGELKGVRYVIIFMATVCILVTFFTLCTFLINTKRFRYPERPIVFYALSYFIVSLIFLAGFILKEKAACNHEIRDENTNDIIQGFTVVKGDHKQACTIMFMALYYFTVNGTIWWLILTITWLLAAGFKWGSEAIEKYSLYYHIVAWGLPAFQTLAVVTFSKIEGDNISGVCFLGLYDSDGLRYLLLAPLCFYLFFGIAILFTGFICLNRVRKSLENDEVNKKKLAKFMMRIGVFSVMYIVPQIVLLAIYIAEHQYRSRWEATWFLKSCSEYRVPCPAANSSVIVLADGYQPNVVLFGIKYVMTLIVALPPLFWVASKKTLLSWQILCCRGNKSPQTLLVQSSNHTNANHKSERGSTKKLLKTGTPKDANDTNHRPRSAGDGGADKDDVFYGFNDAKVHGSSASVAALAAAIDANSRQNEVIQHHVIETKTTHSGSEAGSIARKKRSSQKKEFPKSMKQKSLRANSSGSMSSRGLTSSIHKPSSSFSSTTSIQRRAQSKLNNNLQAQTSSLNRLEIRAKRAPGVTKMPRAVSPMAKSSDSLAVTSKNSRSLVRQEPKNTVVSIAQNNFESTVEV